MKMNFRGQKRAFLLVVIPVVPLLLGGCATPALWTATAAQDWLPQSPANQFLVTTVTGRQDVVVVFSQWTGKPGKTVERRVGWTVGTSPQELAIGIKAIRKLTNACDTVQRLPVFLKDDFPCDGFSAPPGFAVLDAGSAAFSVRLEADGPEPFVLPSSHIPCRTATRWCLMPLAVATDAAIVATLATGWVMGGGK